MLKYICIAIAVLVGEAVAKAAFPMPRLASSCSKTVVRRDITTLSPAEQERFARVVREMHRRGWMDGFGSMHDHISHQIHGNDQFFAWHRRFLRHFESLMQEIDPDVVLPYWNWGTYWQNPYSDPVLSSSLFGGNGRPTDNCVMDGAEARWGRNYPTRNCLTRKFRYGASTGSFWPMRAVRDVMKTAKTHAQFRSRIENGAHGIVHLGLGGDFETMWAPVDVLFFLHHAMIDKIWAEWQSRDPQRFQNVDGYDSAHQPVTADSMMPFYGEEVGTALSTNGPGYCYVYDDVPAPPAVFRKSKVMMTLNMATNITDSDVDTEKAQRKLPALPVEQSLPMEQSPPAEQAQDSNQDDDSGAADTSNGDAEEAAAQFFVNGRDPAEASAKIVNFVPPSPMDSAWLKQRNYDVDEAARMQKLVDDVVAKINLERKQGTGASAR
ncbi:hypothetical protein H4R20_000315 [Coemansia guatemalensis]|uniref:Tyrosinase copper-binding domain-containing protein n=1 Tax=Coemansia guatemalensis TaxID=2761395 RepID=A0A9W8I809_9FUNG|nr:hypothetical protein H4R20_000315 [Coemansia guatemalensis]